MRDPQGDFFAPPEPESIVEPIPDAERREYQEEGFDAIQNALGRNVRRQLVTMATGLGKGHMEGELPRRLDMYPALVLVDRIELADQMARHLYRANPGKSVYIEQGELRAPPHADLVVASVPTLGRQELRRLKKKWAPDYFKLVQSDECHFDLQPVRLQVLRYLEPELLIGWTATPFRGDGQPLARVYDEVVFERTLRWGIESNWLSRYRARRVYSSEDLSNVHTKAGDFDPSEIAQVVNTDWRNSLVISAIEQHAEGRTSIVVTCADKVHVESMTRQLRERGHHAEYITENTRPGDRISHLTKFREGKIRVLCHCATLVYGVDVPRIDCLVWASPTKSLLRYTQQTGRGLRKHPDKTDLLVIDVVDVVGTHHIVTASEVFGERDIDVLGGDVLEAVKRVEKAASVGLNTPEGDSIDDVIRRLDKTERLAAGTVNVETKAEAIDLFRAMKIDSAIEHQSIFPWIQIDPQRYVMRLSGNLVITMYGDKIGAWKIAEGVKKVHELGLHTQVPFKEADRCVKRISPDWRMRRINARWRNEEPTMPQIQRLRQLGWRTLPPGMTRGAASHLIDVHALTKRLRRKSLVEGTEKASRI